MTWAMKSEDYQTIKVPKRFIPEGAKLIEAYLTGTEVIVMGDPPDEETVGEESAHNCDAMGCGSLSHVIYRFRLDEEVIA